MEITFAVLPIVLTLFCGWVMQAFGVLTRLQWDGIEILGFRLLIPVVLLQSLSTSEFSFGAFGSLVGALLLCTALIGVFVFTLRGLAGERRLPNPVFTALFQTSIRWNAFIALAAAELFIGPEGLGLIAVAMAVLVPLNNVGSILVLAMFRTAKTSAAAMLLMVAKNPLVQACALGLALNLSGLHLPQTISQTLDLIGRAALGIGLLSVGANIAHKRLLRARAAVWLGVGIRLVICPAVFLGIAVVIGLDAVQILAGVLVCSVPAATNGYIVTRQMGGDAELYADILVWQTVLSMLLLPFLAYFLTASPL
jgi:malonate transporter